MLDKRTTFVLSAINKMCEEGTYKILEADEILKFLPSKFKTEADGLKQMIKYLKERSYVEIKYSDDKEYCICPLPKGRLYFEQEKSEKKESKIKFKQFFWTAFIGALSGSIIGSIITAIITTQILG